MNNWDLNDSFDKFSSAYFKSYDETNNIAFRKTQALSYQNTEKQVQQSMLPYGLNQTHTHMAQVMTPPSTPWPV